MNACHDYGYWIKLTLLVVTPLPHPLLKLQNVGAVFILNEWVMQNNLHPFWHILISYLATKGDNSFDLIIYNSIDEKMAACCFLGFIKFIYTLLLEKGQKSAYPLGIVTQVCKRWTVFSGISFPPPLEKICMRNLMWYRWGIQLGLDLLYHQNKLVDHWSLVRQPWLCPVDTIWM